MDIYKITLYKHLMQKKVYKNKKKYIRLVAK